ncbi:MAG: hypothetical protein ABSC38_03975 [Verrucomicrobiia bacterium]
MKEPDEQLRPLLKQWGEIEPKANFESNVLRRIRLAQAEQMERVGLPQLLRHWLWQPAMAVAVVMVASAIIGSSVGILSARGTATVTPSELQFLGSGTLAGAYVKASTGGER